MCLFSDAQQRHPQLSNDDSGGLWEDDDDDDRMAMNQQPYNTNHNGNEDQLHGTTRTGPETSFADNNTARLLKRLRMTYDEVVEGIAAASSPPSAKDSSCHWASTANNKRQKKNVMESRLSQQQQEVQSALLGSRSDMDDWWMDELFHLTDVQDEHREGRSSIMDQSGGFSAAACSAAGPSWPYSFQDSVLYDELAAGSAVEAAAAAEDLVGRSLFAPSHNNNNNRPAPPQQEPSLNRYCSTSRKNDDRRTIVGVEPRPFWTHPPITCSSTTSTNASSCEANNSLSRSCGSYSSSCGSLLQEGQQYSQQHQLQQQTTTTTTTTTAEQNPMIKFMSSSDIPMLATLTSFPYRITFANQAFQGMTGRKDIVGSSFYDVFVQEGQQVPSLSACPTLLQKFQDDVVRVLTSNTNTTTTTNTTTAYYNTPTEDCASSTSTSSNNVVVVEDQDVYCKIHVGPYIDRDDDTMQNFIISLQPIDVPADVVVGGGAGVSSSSIIYLPMPQGCMGGAGRKR